MLKYSGGEPTAYKENIFGSAKSDKSSSGFGAKLFGENNAAPSQQPNKLFNTPEVKLFGGKSTSGAMLFGKPKSADPAKQLFGINTMKSADVESSTPEMKKSSGGGVHLLSSAFGSQSPSTPSHSPSISKGPSWFDKPKKTGSEGLFSKTGSASGMSFKVDQKSSR